MWTADLLNLPTDFQSLQETTDSLPSLQAVAADSVVDPYNYQGFSYTNVLHRIAAGFYILENQPSCIGASLDNSGNLVCPP